MVINPLFIRLAIAAVPAAIAALTKVGEVANQALSEGGEAPNLKFPTLGGKFFWNTLAEKNGWKVQQNKLFGNCRILAPNNWRMAWGGGGALEVFLEQMPLLADAYSEAQRLSESKDEAVVS